MFVLARQLLVTSLIALLTVSTSAVASADICDLKTNGASCGPAVFSGAVLGGFTPQPIKTLDELRYYLSATGELDSDDTSTKLLNGLDSIYDVDAGGDNWIKLDYALNSGSGDIVAYIPSSLFTGAGAQTLNLFSRFGNKEAANADSDAEFEEWWVGPATGSPHLQIAEVAEPATLMLLATGLTLAIRRRRKHAR